eukprot:5643007-Prymnesium_polylepis.1
MNSYSPSRGTARLLGGIWPMMRPGGRCRALRAPCGASWVQLRGVGRYSHPTNMRAVHPARLAGRSTPAVLPGWQYKIRTPGPTLVGWL